MFSKSYINEVWKPVVGYDGLYEVSNFGRVRSLNYNHTGKRRILKLTKNKNGYLTVGLHKNTLRERVYVHRLVWEVFNSPIPKGMQINHINEDKTDNRLENLSLVTPKENNNWGTRIARQITTLTNRPDCSKPVLQFSMDGKFIAQYLSQAEAARQLEIHQGHISNCCNGRLKSYKGSVWRYKEEGGTN